MAVYLVVAFHAGLERFSGGFVGVDIFFVLSGYLVTRILIGDLASRGRIRGKQFYARRARRVLPAALVTLVVTAIVWAAVATPAERLETVGGFRAAFLYVANWYFIHQSTDYFAANVTTSPVLHFWSLAVEEQFYLLWPLILGGLWFATRWAGRRQWWVLRAVIGIAAVASAAAALHIGATNLERAYYGTETRAYELLAGALLALTPQLMRTRGLGGRLGRWGTAATMLGIVVVASSALGLSAISRGVFITMLTALLIILLENARGGLVKRALSARPVVYLGRISYGVYLWHWPVIVIMLHGRRLSAPAVFVLACAISTSLAAISFRLLEQPVRASRALDRYRVPVIAVGLAASLLGGVLLAPSILDPASTSVSASGGVGASRSGLRLLDWRRALNDIPPLHNCLGQPVDKCTLVRGGGKRVLLMGDSNARMWIPAVREIAKEQSWTFSVATRPVCPWQRGLQNFVQASFRALCSRYQTDWYERVIPTLDPDLIILVHQAYDDPAELGSFYGPDGRAVLAGSPRVESVLRDASTVSLHALRKSGRRLVIIEPIPLAPAHFDPLSCISKGGSDSRCRYRANPTPTPLESYYRNYARTHADVDALDLDRQVCPRWPTCDPVVGNIIVKRDGSHLTATFARYLAAPLEQLLPR